MAGEQSHSAWRSRSSLSCSLRSRAAADWDLDSIAEGLRPPSSPGTLRPQPAADFGMRHLFALGLLSVLGANLCGGCTPYIPVKDDFGTSALKPTGNIPPEFAEFNNYEPGVNALLADQICATVYIP